MGKTNVISSTKATDYSGSYAGVDIRVFAIISHTYSMEYQEFLKKINNHYDTQLIDVASTDGIYDEQEMLRSSSEEMSSINKEKDSVLSYAQSLADITYKELGEVQTLSYSIYRDKQAVNTLGKKYPKGITRGTATIAGTIIFTVIHERILHELLNTSLGTASENLNLEFMTIDELPPLDIFITFENEYGDKSRLGIFGAEFINEGQVMSVSDLITENSVNYVARHISPLRKVDTAFPDASDFIASSVLAGVPMLDSDYTKASKEIQALKNRWL